MGKRYYCEYCNRAFQDNLTARKKHLGSSQHLRNKQSWFQNFQESKEIVNRKPCHKFLSTGQCPFGNSCKYLHLTHQEIHHSKAGMANSTIPTECDVLFIEPFYGGSHKQLLDLIVTSVKEHATCDVLTLPAKKWHWKARTSALYFAQNIDQTKKYKTIFCSSVLNLCELIGLCPSLNHCKKIVYFHENQLVYPVKSRHDGDFQYGYNQVLTAMVADTVIFNSKFNMDTFLTNISTFLKLIPDHRPKAVEESLKHKCKVLYFPLSKMPMEVYPVREENVLQVVWAHRWEHDKDPETFFNIILQLKHNGLKFKVCIMGQQFTEIPAIFTEAKNNLGADYINHWGYIPCKEEYFKILSSCHVAVSTAKHEFFGVSMLEAAMAGCIPLCPNRLSYPELFPKFCLYNTERQLYKRLRDYARNVSLCSKQYQNTSWGFERFSWDGLKVMYSNVLGI